VNGLDGQHDREDQRVVLAVGDGDGELPRSENSSTRNRPRPPPTSPPRCRSSPGNSPQIRARNRGAHRRDAQAVSAELWTTRDEPWPTDKPARAERSIEPVAEHDGSLLVTNLAGFTRTYPARVADELTAWRRQLADDSAL
jgi:hypothetical protein